jgi:hypothetical protein
MSREPRRRGSCVNSSGLASVRSQSLCSQIAAFMDLGRGLYDSRRSSVACEHLFVTSQGSAYGRFCRALDSQNATDAPATATELDFVSLPDALELVLLPVDDPGRLRRAALAGTPATARRLRTWASTRPRSCSPAWRAGGPESQRSGRVASRLGSLPRAQTGGRGAASLGSLMLDARNLRGRSQAGPRSPGLRA